MISPDIIVEDIPMVETHPGSPAHDLFATVRDKDSDDMYRLIWSDFCLDLQPKIESLGNISDPELLRRELHAIRGMSSQFGLFLLEIYLFAWEARSLNPAQELPRLLPGAKSIAARSIEAIEKAFPHLKISSA